MNEFITCTGMCLGAVIIFCTAKMLSFPRTAVRLFCLNSFAGSVLLLAVQKFLITKAVFIAIPPLAAVGVGILGLPGAILALVIALVP